MALLIASNLRKEINAALLFEGVSFKLERRDRIALAGPNGAGKTTLLRAIVGETELHGGELARSKGVRIALHDQRPPASSAAALLDHVLGGAADLVATEAELARLERVMSQGDHLPETLRRYAEAQARLEHGGGYTWRERVLASLRGLGFTEEDFARPLAGFSGGELTRAALARALAGDPDVLLLDEPTNHLDLGSLEWLERELQNLDAAAIIVSHDRWFLEAATTAVLELEGGRATFFRGPWHEWRKEKASRASALEKAAERQAEELARLERFVARFRYGTKARQAQSKLKRMDRLEQQRVVVPRLARYALGLELAAPKRSGKVVLEVEGLAVSAGSRELLPGVSFTLERGEHVALIGPNGSGKTTLLETVLGQRPSSRGTARLGHGVEPAYFAQHTSALDERGSVLQCVQGATRLNRPQAQALLGRFLFSGWEDHEKPVRALSGGERRRLALAIVVASDANFLVLDEPTNHLDLPSREALEAALEGFPGTVLLVSHDRALLDAVAGRILAIEDGVLRSYHGGWADYVRRREEAAKEAGPEPERRAARESPAAEPKPARPARRRPSELELVEAEIAQREGDVAELERRLAEDWDDLELVAAYRRAREELEALFARWETLFEQIEA